MIIQPQDMTPDQRALLISAGMDPDVATDFPQVDHAAPPPPPPPPVAGEPLAWEETEPVPPQPQLDDELTGGIPEPEDLELVAAPTPQEIAEFKRKYRATKTQVTHRAAQFLRGEITVRDLDDEELKRGRFRDSDGKFRGRSASLIPSEFHEEVMRRMLERGTEKIQYDFMTAIETVVDVMNNSTDDAIRLRAANVIIERYAGKTADKIDLTVAVKPWENTLKGIIKAPPPELLQLGIIDAEIVEDDEEDDEYEAAER